jgi:exosortase/archaeosortase family protein
MLKVLKNVPVFLKEQISEIPKPIRKFALNCLLIFIIWQTVYVFLLEPKRIIDKPLTELVGNLTKEGLQLIYPSSNFTTQNIKNLFFTDIEISSELYTVFMGNQKLIGIADSCNGLNLYILFIGFIIAFPNTFKRKISFGIYGFIIVFGVNVLRCIGLGMVQIHYPHFMVYAHHYIFKIITYGVVFFLWIKFAKIN